MSPALPARCPRSQALVPAPRRLPRALVLALGPLGALAPFGCDAAGGHHAVDDASTLDPGQCQAEAWVEQGPAVQLQHFGPACEAWGVEVGLNLERSTSPAAPRLRSAGLQLKWAREVEPGLSLGASWAAGWQSVSPRFAGHALLVLLSWSPREDLALHLNLGRDLPSQAASIGHHGVALEWQPDAHWQGLFEAWRDGLGSQRRVGLRYLVNERLSVDLSRARFVSTTASSWWALGLNWAFER